jgi:hypothetical protein
MSVLAGVRLRHLEEPITDRSMTGLQMMAAASLRLSKLPFNAVFFEQPGHQEGTKATRPIMLYFS